MVFDDIIVTVLSTILAILFVSASIVYCIYFVYDEYNKKRCQKEFIDNLDEHDKSVILDFQQCHKKNKKNK